MRNQSTFVLKIIIVYQQKTENSVENALPGRYHREGSLWKWGGEDRSACACRPACLRSEHGDHRHRREQLHLQSRKQWPLLSRTHHTGSSWSLNFYAGLWCAVFLCSFKVLMGAKEMLWGRLGCRQSWVWASGHWLGRTREIERENS